MKFELFKTLYDEAIESENLEYFIAERGWQDWMEDYQADEIAIILTKIYNLATNELKDTRDVSRAEFARQYNIPARTLQDWDLGKRTPPTYVKMLLDYATFMSKHD
ncbi:hypothetical protein Javan273_0003 [Streptococcus phage Javan273]|nr:hypothetical protein BKX95_00215 [Streptococcus iniae]QBX16745.1 hypothetical protein Javan273_0003 [Streptococcus phage Javan273]